jgi:hypothetical protein
MYYFITYREVNRHHDMIINDISKDQHPLYYWQDLKEEFPNNDYTLLFYSEISEHIGEDLIEAFE